MAYKPLKFSPGLEFCASQQPIHDLESLASVIGGLEDEPTKAVIRGLPLLPENEPVARQSQNFSSTSHHWCMIDIDSLPWDGDLHDQKAMVIWYFYWADRIGYYMIKVTIFNELVVLCPCPLKKPYVKPKAT